jgi:hypothetical protein
MSSLKTTLLASAARTSSSSAIATSQSLARYDRVLLLLDVTVAAAAVGDLLDVFIQKNVGPESAPIWTDFVHFTQVLGNGGAKQFVAENIAILNLAASALHVVQDAVLTAGINQGPWSDRWRVKWVIAGATPSFTFSVEATLAGPD